MKIKVVHLDAMGALRCTTESLSHLAFAKHMAFAGIGLHSPYRFIRFLSNYIELFQFWRDDPRRFSLPRPLNHDPTEKSILSNRIGRAIADYLAKTIYSARYTHCYEDAMVRFGHKIAGPRPDFYCDTLKAQFALEAKGFSKASISRNEMNRHKSQSQQGPIPVNFSVASVSYDLYSAPKVKFHDPANDESAYHHYHNRQLRGIYYESILELLESLIPKKYRGESGNYQSYGLREVMGESKHDIGEDHAILVHKAIVERRWESNEWLRTIKERQENSGDTYIDLDGIGLTNNHSMWQRRRAARGRMR